MKPADGMNNNINIPPGHVLKLQRALYGIKQAPRVWNININEFLITLGFKPCVKDTCIYVKKSKSGGIIIIGLFVDDIASAFSVNDRKEWNDEIKERLKLKYELSDMGAVQHILGMKITRTGTKTLYIDQQVYVNDKVKEFNLDECKKVITPENSSTKLSEHDDSEHVYKDEVTLYRMMVGSLMYASISTRPDITHAVGQAARHMQQPKQSHMVAAKRIFRYLSGARDHCLKYTGSNDNSDENNMW